MIGILIALLAAAEPAPDPAEAKGLLEAGEFADAAQAFAGLRASGNQDLGVRLGLIEALDLSGRYEEAIEAAAGDEAPIATRRAEILAGIGRRDEAEAAYLAVLGSAPRAVEAIVGLGRLLNGAGRREEAKARFERAIDVYQGLSREEAKAVSAGTYVSFGLALIGLNRFKEANSVMFWQAQKIEKDSLPYLFALGDALIAKYNYPDARSCFRDALRKRPRHPRALCGMAEAMLADFGMGSDRYEQVADRVRQALEVNPRHLKAHELLGDLALIDGDVAAASASFRKALETNPNAIEVRGKLGACALLSNDREAFEAEEARAASASAKPAEFYAAAAETVNRHYRFELAVTLAEKALEVDPDYWPVYVTLGMGYLRTCRDAEGEEYIARAFERDPFNVWAFNTRKLIRYMKAEFTEEKRPHFVIRMPKEDAPFLVPYLAPLLERQRERLSAKFGFEPPVAHIEAFSDHQWFSARTTGLPGISAAGACFGRLVTLATPKAIPEHWGIVACHEFAHVVTVLASNYRIPRWLTEGISVREEGLSHPGWEREFEQPFVNDVGHGRLPSVLTFDASFHKPTRPGEVISAYYMASVIVRFIEETYGEARLRDLVAAYRTKTTKSAFPAALGVEPEAFDRAFAEYARGLAAATGLEPLIEPDEIQGLKARAEKDPSDPEAHARLAWAAYFGGNRVDVPIHAGRALEIDAEFASAHAVLGLQAARESKQGEAIDHLRKAIAGTCAYRFIVLSTLGKLLAEKGEKQDAIAAFEEARTLAPRQSAAGGSGSVLGQLAKLREEAGEAEAAEACLRALVAVDHRDSSSRRTLARRLGARGAWSEAADLFEEIVLSNPFRREAHEELAFALEKAGRPADAVREYEVLLAYPDAPEKEIGEALERLRGSSVGVGE
ncbi:MAG: tetratricopeptide repeat protein [Planctomycetes bacterium]|nr:tetratricopeptide repeat protein [Planctomycetota bacterium]